MKFANKPHKNCFPTVASYDFSPSFDHNRLQQYHKHQMSLVHISSLDELKKQDRFYLRYYRTVIQARKLNQQIYGDQRAKGNLQLKVQHPLRVACLTEQIKNQKIGDYHMTWLVGLLHDTKQDDIYLYNDRIDDVLKDLLPQERKKVKEYIDQLTSDESLTKGQKKRNQIQKMEILELIPCWIRIFDKFDNCRRFRINRVGKTKAEIDGYCSIAYLCYHRGLERFQEIRKNLQPQITHFYETICAELGGLEKVHILAEKYIDQNSK